MSDRSAFLRGLASLPLVGGSVAILGRPTAAAVPVTPDLLERYRDWLAVEYGETLVQIDATAPSQYAVYRAEYRRQWCVDNRTLNPNPKLGRFATPPIVPPSARAAVILAAAGVSIQTRRRL